MYISRTARDNRRRLGGLSSHFLRGNLRLAHLWPFGKTSKSFVPNLGTKSPVNSRPIGSPQGLLLAMRRALVTKFLPYLLISR